MILKLFSIPSTSTKLFSESCRDIFPSFSLNCICKFLLDFLHKTIKKLTFIHCSTDILIPLLIFQDTLYQVYKLERGLLNKKNSHPSFWKSEVFRFNNSFTIYKVLIERNPLLQKQQPQKV